MELNKEALEQLKLKLLDLIKNNSYNDLLDTNLLVRLIPKNKNGNKIYIKKKNRGKFTASAKAAGESVLEHARSILNDPDATALLRKRANFVVNSSKWDKN